MLDDLIKQLHDTDAGWATRKDAALRLGTMANQALIALSEHFDDTDVDVRETVTDAIGDIANSCASLELPAAPSACMLDDAVRACEKPGRRDIATAGAGYVITVRTDDGRAQQIYVTPFEWKDGTKLIRVYTRCGPVSDDAVQWALRTNLKLPHGAIALAKEGGGEEFVMTKCFLASELSAGALKASVKELAHYGDWIEKKLTGLDEL